MSRKTTVDELRGLMLQNTKAALESIESLRSENARLRVALTEAKTVKREPDPRVEVLEDSALVYPCDKCGKLRSKDQGGTIFTVCDTCWDEHYNPIAAQRGEGQGMKLQRYEPDIFQDFGRLMEPSESGEYVKLSDVLALLDKEILRAKAIRGDYKPESNNWARADAICSNLSRLRAELGAE